MKPALTNEEWNLKAVKWSNGGFQYGIDLYTDLQNGMRNVLMFQHPGPGPGLAGLTGTGLSAQSRHAVAALCLYGQPFGFDTQDVRFLRAWSEDSDDDLTPAGREKFKSIADRIEALLPSNSGSQSAID